LRIFPAFFAYLLTITVLSSWQPMGVNRDTLIAAATFTWNYLAFWATPPSDIWPLGHLWTLALEQQFYLLWPVVLLLVGRRRAFWIAVGLMLWCPVARVGSYYLFPAQRGFLGMMFHTGVDSLMAGCAAALLLTSPTWREWLESRRPGATITALTLTWLLLLSPLLSQLVRGFSVAFGLTLDAMAASFIVAWVHYAPTLRIQKVL
jgi:peptidoglycan/LPS O-acetylase OafA/YrhL